MKKILLSAASAVVMAGCSLNPEPLTTTEIVTASSEDAKLIAASEAPLTKPLDLSHATARAVKYNLQYRVQVMQQALAERSFELAKLDMLPVLAASGTTTHRDNFNASSSESLETRRQSLEPSYSEDRDHHALNARFSFNIVDFGISYLQARQESNRFMVAVLARRKTMEKLVQQVRTAYWRAGALQQIAPEVEQLQTQNKAALATLQRVRAEQLRTPLSVLEDIRSLMEISQQLEALQQSVNAAQIDLAQLVNLRPGEPVALELPAQLPALPTFPPDFQRMEELALVNSVDYSAELYNVRVDRDESRKALLRLVPGVELFATADYDSNSFLTNNSWETAGARVTFNISRVLSLPDVLDNNDARGEVSRARRLAAHMAVITKVHLGWQSLANAKARLDRAKTIDDLDSDIARLSAQSFQSDATSGIVDLRNRVRGLRSKVSNVLAYADAQDAYAQFLQGLGLHPVPDDYQRYSVDELAASIEKAYDRFSNGDLPVIPTTVPPPEKKDVASATP